MPSETPTDLTLRPATPDDAASVTAVHLASRAAAVRSATMPASVHHDDETLAWLTERLGIDEVWVAEAAGAIVAYVRLTREWLDDLYVVPGHAGRGIGSALLALAQARRPAGFGLWVFEVNAPARAFYAAHGLVEVERTDGSDNEERAPDVRVVWSP
ncbi:GNAT family N-acetyltransferase [Nocardioides sp.]|jgi:GNAT superfamily N-acetyltransferase|uniref:GNAT family N-acetyltransferase n=1 Tax=Nocardioides sp. TaxID=35761 RepID=UPI001D3423A2|nr:GNAT family N-acetyltransferase [Nocardioides sp.]MBU1803185.1 GNAT family N-acetyltransferase [Actinomycetota bacterium]